MCDNTAKGGLKRCVKKEKSGETDHEYGSSGGGPKTKKNARRT